MSNIWEYKILNNANIANFVYLWKSRFSILFEHYLCLKVYDLFKFYKFIFN